MKPVQAGGALDEIVRKVQNLDMDGVRLGVEERERGTPQAPSAGGV